MEFTDGDDGLNRSASGVSQGGVGAGGRERVTSLSPTGKRRHRDPNAAATQQDSWRTRKPQKEDPNKGPVLADFAEQVNRLSAQEETRARVSSMSPVAFLSTSTPSQLNPFATKEKFEPVLEPSNAILNKYLTSPEEVKMYNNANITRRPDTVAIRRYRMTLVGAGEAGKTSLRKCFNSNPLFFKNLPEVGTTTGIDTQHHRIKVSGDSVIEVDINDFAGQEVYHSHSLFLTNRTLFVFVWNMSNVEQTFDDYGISDEEEKRLKQWADVVQAKCPGASIVVVGTHKDQLRDPSRKSVVLILNKVCKLISDYIATFKASKDVPNINIGGSFCVSCRDRTVIPENIGGPTKIKELFQWVAELCHKYSRTGNLYSQGSVPRYVVSLIATLEAMKSDMETVLLPMKAYNALCKQLGVPKELLHKITTMLHDWGVLYLFDKSASKLGRQDCVFLHPLWLSVMVSSVFTYAHACTAVAYERATMEVGDIPIEACDQAEPSKLILEGVLCESLAKQLFSKVLLALKRQPNAQNIEICFTMLRHMDLIYKNTSSPEEGPYPVTHSVPPVGDQYYVPSIYPRVCPTNLSSHISRLTRNTGVHMSYSLVPLPKEFIHMLHTRVGHMVMRLQVNAPCVHRDPPTKRVWNNWRDAWWLAGGGGEGSELGIGPLRALAFADMEDRRLHVWAVGGGTDHRLMSPTKLCAHFHEGVVDLASKYPGMVLTEDGLQVEQNAVLEDDTFVVLMSCLRPPEVLFLMESLGLEPTEPQRQKLDDVSSATMSDDCPTSPLGQMKTSLLLDKLVKACMLQDSSIVTS